MMMKFCGLRNAVEKKEERRKDRKAFTITLRKENLNAKTQGREGKTIVRFKMAQSDSGFERPKESLRLCAVALKRDVFQSTCSILN